MFAGEFGPNFLGNFGLDSISQRSPMGMRRTGLVFGLSWAWPPVTLVKYPAPPLRIGTGFSGSGACAPVLSVPRKANKKETNRQGTRN